MLIINQDRDSSVEFNFKNGELTTFPIFHDGVCFGYNLNANGVMIGTFDNLRQVQMEFTNILTCPYNVYMVSGCSFIWGDWEVYKEIMCS